MIRFVRISLLFLSIIPIGLMGQALTYSGKIISVNDLQPIQGVSILLKEGDKIVAFGRTNALGEFVVKSPAVVEQRALYLEVNHLSYHRQRIDITPDIFHYPVSMQEKIVALDEVKVGKRPAVQEVGDTLIYNVKYFADSLDRSIGDVLKKMPGMEVRDDGRILYNGRGISDLYIDGDNLLGNRYGIGTKAIPHDAILSVEVYRNHQKIKVLKDKLNSDDVALNLIVREDARMKLLGGGTASSNVFKNYHLDANLMMFNKKIKTLNALMLNNTGYDIQYALQDLVNIDVSSMEIYTLSSSLKNIPENNTFDMYENNSMGFSTNHHMNTSGGWKIRTNAAISTERGKEAISSLLNYLTEEDSQTISEKSTISNRPVGVVSNWNFVKNMDNQYMDVLFDVNYRNRGILDGLQATDYLMFNTLNQKRLWLKGNLNYIPRTKGKGIWNFRIGSNYKSNSEQLTIESADFIAVMLPYAPVSKINQYFRRENLDIGGRIDFRPPSTGPIRQYYLAEQFLQREGLKADIFENNHDDISPFPDFHNDMVLHKIKTEVSSGFSLDQRGLKANLHLPLGIQRLGSQSAKGEVMDDRVDILFQPTLSLRYSLSGYHGVKLNAHRQQNFGNISDVYHGSVLVNPRTIRDREGFIPYYDLWKVSIEYNVQDPMNLLFAKIGYYYSLGKQNFLYQNNYNQEETIGIGIREETNNVIRHEANMYVSKFVDILRTTSSFKMNWKLTQNWMMVDNQMLTLTPKTIEIIPELNGKVGKRLEWRYHGSFIFQYNQIEGHPAQDKFYQFVHNMQTTYQVSSKTYFTVGGKYSMLRNGQHRIDFKNMRTSLTYRINKRFLERIEVVGSNLLNEKAYGFVIQSANSFFQQESRLRERMILVSTAFNIN